MSNILISLTKKKVRVLCYHRVNKYKDYFGLDTDVFENQIKYIKKKYNIITLLEFKKILNKESISEKSLLITFDDGYQDFYTNVFPILKKYSVPATIFLTTDFIDGKMWMWHDIYRYIFENTRLNNLTLIDNNGYIKFNLENYNDLLKARKILHNYIKDKDRKERIKYLHNLAKDLRVNLPLFPPKKYAPLTWDQVRELSENGIEFGSHTCSHEILSKLENSKLKKEIIDSKKRIEKETQREIFAFAYPNGMNGDFSIKSKVILQQSGYICAFTMISGLNDLNIDRYELQRIPSPTMFNNYFIREVSGLNNFKKFFVLKDKSIRPSLF